MKFNIVIPSMGRAGKVLTHKRFPKGSYRISIPESQFEAYRKYHDFEELVTHPDTVIGLTNKWQFIIEHYLTDDALVLFDDDISHVIRLSSFSDEKDKRLLDSEVIYGIVEQVVSTAIDLGVNIFGWNIMPHSIQFNTGFKPFELSGNVHGAAMGFLKHHNLAYNPEFLLKGDYRISLLNAYKNRMCLVDNRYAFAAEDTFTGEGGQSVHRTTEREASEVKLLQRYFGRQVVQAGHKKSRGRKAEYMNIESVSLHLPF